MKIRILAYIGGVILVLLAINFGFDPDAALSIIQELGQ